MGVYDVERFKAVVEQDEIHRMAQSEDAEERQEAANQLLDNFTILPDKNRAWDDLHRLTQDEKSYVRVSAVSAKLK